MREDVSILSKGFNPASDTKKKMRKAFEAIQILLPPGSDIKLILKKFPKNFEGTVVVRSSMGDFTASAESKELLALVKDLKSTLKSQVFRFRDNRADFRKAG